MAFDRFDTSSIPRPGGDKVHVLLTKVPSKRNALELRVTIGGDVAAKLGWAAGQRVHLGVGRPGTADQGLLAIWPAADGTFKMRRYNGTRTLTIVTRCRHPALVSTPHEREPAVLVQVARERLVVKLPPRMLAPTPAPIGQIMGDENRQRRSA